MSDFGWGVVIFIVVFLAFTAFVRQWNKVDKELKSAQAHSVEVGERMRNESATTDDDSGVETETP